MFIGPILGTNDVLYNVLALFWPQMKPFLHFYSILNCKIYLILISFPNLFNNDYNGEKLFF